MEIITFVPTCRVQNFPKCLDLTEVNFKILNYLTCDINNNLKEIIVTKYAENINEVNRTLHKISK